MPGELDEGVISPVTVLISSPAGTEVYAPPVVPVSTTSCGEEIPLQNGEPGYVMVALQRISVTSGE